MEKIGFIGLGIMGKPMALNLRKKGYELFVMETSNAASDLAKQGATVLKTYREIAEHSDVVITIVPDSPEVEEVVFSANGVLAGLSSGKLFIDMSTIAPASAMKVYKAFEKNGVDALDAPVSGGQVGAESASLSIMVGGREKPFQRALPIFEAMGKNIVHVGEAGAGQTTKACNQMIVGMTIQAVAEAFTFAKKAGVDLAKMREALLGDLPKVGYWTFMANASLSGILNQGSK